MIKGSFPIEDFRGLQTPFYAYDKELLQKTLDVINAESNKYGYHVHYAVKANANPIILQTICASNLGADCVSGGEVKAAIEAGFSPDKIVFAGVGKADWEIDYALDNDIFCFNVESEPELENINVLAAQKNNLPIFEYTPLQVKQSVVGYGRAEKKQVQEMTRVILKLEKIPKPDDTADALAMAICHAHASGSLMGRLRNLK